MKENEKSEKEFLEGYNIEKYERPSITNDVIIFTSDDIKEDNLRKVPKKGMQILLIKRKEHPCKNKWAIPGGFVQMDENLEDGARRKLKEKTRIENVYIEQLGTFGDVKRDPRTRVVSVANLALIAKENIKYTQPETNKETQWFWIEKKVIGSNSLEDSVENRYKLTLISEKENIKIEYEIMENIRKTILREREVTYKLLEGSSAELAFDHYKIIDYALDRLRNKVEYTPIALNLLPRLFTVKELQNVYEAIMGREILNFRRKMDNMIVETDEKIDGKPFRPAKVFKFNENWEHNF